MKLKEDFSKERLYMKLYRTHGFCKCGKWVGEDKLTLDHILPISKAPEGFVYTIDDVQFLCGSCNSIKGAN